jgi:hypothetical protein
LVELESPVEITKIKKELIIVFKHQYPERGICNNRLDSIFIALRIRVFSLSAVATKTCTFIIEIALKKYVPVGSSKQGG